MFLHGGCAGKTILGESMAQEQTSQSRKWLNILARTAFFFLMAFIIGWTLNRISVQLERSAEPAGFKRGLLQGALMPMAMPNLVVGKDIVIYAERNTGVPYKLGYTAGVNGAGLFFFGLFFWRLNRLRREVRAGTPSP